MTGSDVPGFVIGNTYRFKGIVTGPYKVHAADVVLTFGGAHFDACLNQEGQEIRFRVFVEKADGPTLFVKSEPFTLPSTSDLSNLEIVCSAEISLSKLTGVLNVPAYSVQLVLDLHSSL